MILLLLLGVHQKCPHNRTLSDPKRQILPKALPSTPVGTVGKGTLSPIVSLHLLIKQHTIERYNAVALSIFCLLSSQKHPACNDAPEAMHPKHLTLKKKINK